MDLFPYVHFRAELDHEWKAAQFDVLLSEAKIEDWMTARKTAQVGEEKAKEVSEEVGEVLIKLWEHIAGVMVQKLETIPDCQPDFCLLFMASDTVESSVSSNDALEWVQESHDGCSGYAEAPIVKAMELYTSKSYDNIRYVIKRNGKMEEADLEKTLKIQQGAMEEGIDPTDLDMVRDSDREEMQVLKEYLVRLKRVRTFVDSHKMRALLPSG